jgi:deoxyribodipyrimidine photo-lyase
MIGAGPAWGSTHGNGDFDMQRQQQLDPVHVVWFKRDLRIEDHRPLARAAAMGRALPLFVVEPDLWREPDMSARQWAFVIECLEELRASLAALGQPLVVRVGAVPDVLEELDAAVGIAALHSHEETGNARTYRRDIAVADWCQQRAIPWREERQGGVIRRLASRNGWAGRWDRFMAEPITPPPGALAATSGLEAGTIPSSAELRLAPDACPGRQRGGRGEGLACLTGFLDRRGEPYRTAMSSPLQAFDACSRLSPHLAWGTLAMREVAQATWRRQRELKALSPSEVGRWRGAMTSFSGRLHWRCHFMQKLEDEPRLEFENLHRAYDALRTGEPDRARLEAWRRGETGWPFVDACMRALAATGWMNFRMRAMLMAVASYHLWLDWRRPGEHLARLFTDYEPGIHWPQVQMQSGTTGINTVRIYNPIKQGYDQDPEGVFVRKWLPELDAVPDRFVHEPWKWENAATVLDKAYPWPILDHAQAAKAARQKIWSIRAAPEFRDEANRIQGRHGSRKSGMANTGRRRKPAPRDTRQLTLGLEPPGE